MTKLLQGQKLPDPPKAQPLPDPNSASVKQARRRRLQSEKGRSGRASTVLTAGSRESLGA